mgnify:CR=1 FL=1
MEGYTCRPMLSRSCLSDHAKCNGNAERVTRTQTNTHKKKQPTQGVFLSFFLCVCVCEGG